MNSEVAALGIIWLVLGIGTLAIILAKSKNKRLSLRIMPSKLAVAFIIIVSVVLWPLLIWQETTKKEQA